MKKPFIKIDLEFSEKEYKEIRKYTDKIENADKKGIIDDRKILKKTILEYIRYNNTKKKAKKEENIHDTLKRIEHNICRIDTNIGNIYEKIYKNQIDPSSLSTKSSNKYDQYYIEIPADDYNYTLDNMYEIPVEDILYFEIIYKYKEGTIRAALPNLNDICIRLYYYDENGWIKDLKIDLGDLNISDIHINRKMSIVKHLYKTEQIIKDKFANGVIKVNRKIYKQSIDQVIETIIYIVKKSVSHIDEDTNQLFFKTDCDSKNISVKVKKELDNDDIFKQIVKEWNKNLKPDIQIIFEDRTKEVNLNPLILERIYQNQIQKDYENLFEDGEFGGEVFNFYSNEDLKSNPFKIRLDRFAGLVMRKIYKENSDVKEIDFLHIKFYYFSKNKDKIELMENEFSINFKNINKPYTYLCYLVDFMNTIKDTYKDHLIYIEKYENSDVDSTYYLFFIKDLIEELSLNKGTPYVILFNKNIVYLSYQTLYEELIKKLKLDPNFKVLKDKIIKKDNENKYFTLAFGPKLDK